jgi:arginine decarboxylase
VALSFKFYRGVLKLNTSGWSIKDSEKLYHFSGWGDGYYGINPKGNVCVYPYGDKTQASIDLYEVVQEMANKDIRLPAVIRFHDILRSQVIQMNKTFQETIKEANYNGDYCGVYPIKVNQLREVVEEIVDAGAEFNFGLEAGSKAELITVLALNKNQHSLTILNGYKDREYMKLALLGRKLERNVIVVIEKFSELPLLLSISKEMNIEPLIGIRAKLATKGAGKWANSTGENAKFGLSAIEIVKAVEYLKEHNSLHCLKLFHYHIGSQIPDIRTIKESLTEGARIFCKLYKMGAPIQYFDVGGGLGVNYDGSRSSANASINYKMKDYVGDVVYILKDICDEENIQHPNIVTESGRALTAHHSLVVSNIFGKVKDELPPITTAQKKEHNLVNFMRELLSDLNQDNFQDVYFDAVLKKDESVSAFKLGVIDLKDRATIELFFEHISHRVAEIANNVGQDNVAPEIQKLKEKLTHQYLCNLSVFQSAADIWAIKQIFPIAPIHQLEIEPTVDCTIADITCDSDGKIDEFLGEHNSCDSMKMHELGPQPYFIGVFLTGAYQDIMGDMHNLFGRLNEVHVFADNDDESGFYIEETIKGQSAKDVLSIMQYNCDMLAITVKNNIDSQVKMGKIKPRESVELIDFYEHCLNSYTYLESFEH